MNRALLRNMALSAGILLGVGFLIALCLAPFGDTPFEGIVTLFSGAFGSARRFSESLTKTVPLLFTGLSVTLAFRSGALNIGAEGQFLLGALGAASAGSCLGGWSPWLAVPLTLGAATLAAGVWGGIAGLLKAKRGVPEVISTILLNFIAVHWVSALIRGPLRNPVGGLPESVEIAAAAHMPRLVEGYRLHWGLPLGILLAVGLYVLLARTTAGFRMRAVGFNPDAATYAGYSPQRLMAGSLVLAGMLAGIGGGLEVCGITFKVYDNLSPGYGYTAIAVALLARLNPLAVIPTAFFFGALEQGAGTLQRELDVPLVMVYVVQALVILLALLLGFHRPATVAREEE